MFGNGTGGLRAADGERKTTGGPSSGGLILGVETSCDETAAAVVERGRRVLSNVVASQIELHQKFGGVVPEVASRRHVELIMPVIDEALERAGVSLHEVDGIAVTYGPGLVGSLLVGLAAAKALALALDKPFVGVNHIEGHIYANFLSHPELEPPLVCLTVAGGHTVLFYVPDYGEYEVLGSTRDDAAGEAFDKIARVMGLPYPGGPEIDRIAREYRENRRQTRREYPESGPEDRDTGREHRDTGRDHREAGRDHRDAGRDHPETGRDHREAGRDHPDTGREHRDTGRDHPDTGREHRDTGRDHREAGREHRETGTRKATDESGTLTAPTPDLPRAMLDEGYEFSFSGLKTAALNYINQVRQRGGELDVPAFAHEFQEAIVDVLVVKTMRAAEDKGVDRVIMAGGVASNSRLRQRMASAGQERGLNVYWPAPVLCTDNAAMIAAAGYYRLQAGERADLDLNARPGLALR